MIPEVEPDIGFNTFLIKYFATHSSDDPMFRDAVVKVIEDKLDYSGMDFADATIDGIKAANGHHPDIRDIQTIVDQESGYKFARLMMSIAQGAGNLPDIMRYLGRIAADRRGVELGPRFEEAVQDFLVQVGHTQVDESSAATQRQMSVMPMDGHVEYGESSQRIMKEEQGADENFEEEAPAKRKKVKCFRFSKCTCIPNDDKFEPLVPREKVSKAIVVTEMNGQG